MTALTAAEATAARAAHEDRADALTAAHRERKQRGEKHAVEDFLFTYYPFSPARLRRWHPGWRVGYEASADLDADGNPAIADVDEAGRRSWYVDEAGPEGTPAVRRADVARYLAERASAFSFMTRLLRASTLTRRRPEFGCFGLHEWAMAYRTAEVRQHLAAGQRHAAGRKEEKERILADLFHHVLNRHQGAVYIVRCTLHPE